HSPSISIPNTPRHSTFPNYSRNITMPARYTASSFPPAAVLDRGMFPIRESITTRPPPLATESKLFTTEGTEDHELEILYHGGHGGTRSLDTNLSVRSVSSVAKNLTLSLGHES